MTEQEKPLGGGSITGATRVGNSVRRETGPWTSTIHALLNHLETVGFRGSPRVLGIDDQGREILTFIDGESATYPWPAMLFTADGMRAMGRLIREFHDAVAGFTPPDDAFYRIGRCELKAGEIVCHGDLGYWNTVWDGGSVVGIIDWDFAEPMKPLCDVAQAAIYSVPLRDDKYWFETGAKAPPDRKARLEALCEGYGGIEPREVLDAALEVQQREIERLKTLGGAGMEPWHTFAERGQGSWLQADADWIQASAAELA